MHVTKPYLYHKAIRECLWSLKEPDDPALPRALELYWKARIRGRLMKAWSSFTGGDRGLIDLNSIKIKKFVYSWRYVGVRDVQINKIVGSEGLCGTFDRAFYPLRAQDEARWLSVALSKLNGSHTPPIDLVQIASRYFAQNGQYHISVARAMGQKVIKAYVTRWDVSERSVGKRWKVTIARSPEYISDDSHRRRKVQLTVKSQLLEKAREGVEHVAEI
ncbi:MAG TPA: hypothetical protein G4O14_14040 [Anaerolineae bacterium]|nr:hypothetical protein [Anaerolineae bacterium]